MRLQTLVIAILLFSVTIVVMSNALVSVNTTYQDDTTTIDTSRFNQLEEINSTVVDIKNELQAKNDTNIIEDTFNAFVKSGFTTAKLVFGVIPLTNEIMVATAEVIPIPPVVTFALVTLVVALVVFTFISAIFKWRL